MADNKNIIRKIRKLITEKEIVDSDELSNEDNSFDNVIEEFDQMAASNALGNVSSLSNSNKIPLEFVDNDELKLINTVLNENKQKK